MRSRLKRREADVENCGIDVAMKSSLVCILDGRGAVMLEQGCRRTTRVLRAC